MAIPLHDISVSEYKHVLSCKEAEVLTHVEFRSDDFPAFESEDESEAGASAYNRRGSKDSQLR